MAPGKQVNTRGVEAQRGALYGLLARLMASPPDQDLLLQIGMLEGDDTLLGTAIAELALAARRTNAEKVAEEYHDLFVGLTRGELQPYCSYYLTGFLHEKPLALLRGDMARMGIARQEGVSEPEDHIGALCDMMRGMALGEFDVSVAEQHRFFDAHIGVWAKAFWDDLVTAEAADFYVAVAGLGRTFFDVEREAFAMAA